MCSEDMNFWETVDSQGHTTRPVSKRGLKVTPLQTGEPRVVFASKVKGGDRLPPTPVHTLLVSVQGESSNSPWIFTDCLFSSFLCHLKEGVAQTFHKCRIVPACLRVCAHQHTRRRHPQRNANSKYKPVCFGRPSIYSNSFCESVASL